MSRAMCHSRFVLIAVALVAAGCDDSTAPSALPTKLAFVGLPDASQLGHQITPAVRVAIQDAYGATVDTATATVTVAIGANPGGGTLLGTTTVAAVHGIAVFTDLRIDRIGTGFTLAATSGPLTGTASAAFDIRPLAIAREPVSSGGSNTCGVTTAGAAYCWGSNRFGQLGDGDTAQTTSPAAVSGGLMFASVGADVGGQHRCGVTTTGAAYCWGYHAYGQLGTGTMSGPQQCQGSTPCSATPLAVPGGLTFAAVSGGIGHTCGLTTTGAAYCWGLNFTGQLGVGTTTSEVCSNNPCSTTPVAVAGGLTFIAISAGASHTCGITAAGSAYCWGANTDGQLGDGTVTQRTSPVAVASGLTFAAVSAGIGYTCGVATTGEAYCWGLNNTGQLGIGTTSGPQICATGNNNPCSMTPVAVQGGLTFTMVSAGGDAYGHGHVCGVTAAAAAYCWGDNVLGQLGDGTVTPRTSPVAVGGGLSFVDVSAGSNYDVTGAPGYEHTCGVTTAGVAYCWGVSINGQLGTGTTTGPQACTPSYCSTMPVAVLGGLSFEP